MELRDGSASIYTGSTELFVRAVNDQGQVGMKLTIRRGQEATRKGVTFHAFLHLALLPDEMEIVTRYQLHGFSFDFQFTLAQLLQGYKYTGASAADNNLVRLQTQVVLDLNSVIKVENSVKSRCKELLIVLNNLRQFDGTQEFVYERSTDTQST